MVDHTALPQVSTHAPPAGAGAGAVFLNHVLTGDRRLFDLFYGLYFPRIYRYTLRRLGDPKAAERITQAVFLRAFGSEEPVAADSTMLSWLLEITRNELRRIPPN